MASEQVKARVRGFLEKHVRRPVADSDNLFARGLLNSLFALQLVVFVEKTFGVRAESEDLSLDNFHSIDAISAFVQRKRPQLGAVEGDVCAGH